jgi:signal transduction histidine kinase
MSLAGISNPTERLILQDEDEKRAPVLEPWRVLVVDDDPEVHAVTRLALNGYTFEDRPIEILDAHSAAEARQILKAHADIGLILLDVVMETDHAGLDLARHIRDELQNTSTRIVLRTGQPGQAPAREVVSRYEIDDYRTKTELTFERLYIVVMTALRTFRLLRLLEQRQRELLDSNEELERFAYVASHDMQTPLRGIVSFTQLLKKRLGNTLDEDTRRLAEYIEQGGRDLHLLVNDLLEFSRVGRREDTHRRVDLNLCLDNALRKLRGTIEERGAVIERVHLPAVIGDPTQLEQLFRNLIENGLKFQPGDQPVVRISAERLDGQWEIRVSDRGIGIEPQHLVKVFEIFRRLHTPDKFPGTGIGLAICKKVVTLHGGTIRAESTPGEGTSFIIRLPAIPDEAA